jgi:hypothetical protein
MWAEGQREIKKKSEVGDTKGGVENKGSIRRSTVRDGSRFKRNKRERGIHIVAGRKGQIGGGQNRVEPSC